MSEPTTLADLIGTEPLPTDAVRKCKQCAEVKPFAASHWRTEPNGKPRGWMCKACDSKRSSRKARRRTEVAQALRNAAAGGGGTAPIHNETRAAVAAQLDATEALRAGVRKVNDTAGRVLAKVFEYALDPASPHHEWALKMVAERVMPAKLFAELGLAGAGLTAKGGQAAPNVQIIVQAAQPSTVPVPAAITVRATEVDDGQMGSEPAEEGATDGSDTEA